MNIIVCVKQVPATDTKIQVAGDKKNVDYTGVNFVVNPYDEFAIEAGLQLKEKLGGEVIILSMGPERVTSGIRQALAMGADKAIWIKDDSIVTTSHDDPFVIANAMAEAIKGMQYDLILLGKQAVDDDNAQLAPRLAELLNLPSMTVVTKFEINGNTGIAEREVEGGKEVIEFSLPCVIACQKGLNEPRYASLKGIMAAKKKPIEEKIVNRIEPKLEIKSLEYPPPRSGCKKVETAQELAKLLREEAKII
jgi:electron transfer flavoprotein beta subunit